MGPSEALAREVSGWGNSAVFQGSKGTAKGCGPPRLSKGGLGEWPKASAGCFCTLLFPREDSLTLGAQRNTAA